MIAGIVRAFSYMSALLVLAIGVVVGVLMFQGHLTSERWEQAGLALRGELEEKEDETVPDPYAGLNELQISDKLRDALRALRERKAAERDTARQSQAMADAESETVRRLRESLAEDMAKAQLEADRLEKLLVAYHAEVVDPAVQHTVETWKSMRPKDLVKTIAPMKDDAIAEHLVLLDPEQRAGVFSEMTKQLGAARAAGIMQEVEKRKQQAPPTDGV